MERTRWTNYNVHLACVCVCVHVGKNSACHSPTMGTLTARAVIARMRIILPKLADDGSSCLTATAAMASDGGGLLSADHSLCLVHGPDSGQPFLCEHQSSGDW